MEASDHNELSKWQGRLAGRAARSKRSSEQRRPAQDGFAQKESAARGGGFRLTRHVGFPDRRLRRGHH